MMDTTMNDAIRVFGTKQEINIEDGQIAVAPFVTDHTQAVIHKMTAMRVEAAIRNMVDLSIMEDLATRMNKTGRGLLADRIDLAGDGVSQLATHYWSKRTDMRFTSRAKPTVDEASAIPRDLWNGDEGNDNVSMH